MRGLFLLCSAVVLSLMLLMVLLETFLDDYKNKISLAWNNFEEELLTLPHEESFDHENSIFFIESFGKDYISARSLCSIESAARIHRNTFIDVLMTSQTLLKSEGIKSLLKAYSNVRFFNLNATTLSSETTLKEWVLQEKWKLVKYSEMSLGDILRYLLLYKYGGIYLDMDVIVLKNLTKQENFAGLESEGSINCAVMGFKKGHPFLNDCIAEIPKPVNVSRWGPYGPILITNVFKRRCHAQPPNTTLKECPDIRLYKRETLYPIHWEKWRNAFREDQEFTDTLLNHPDFLTLHIWNSYSKNFSISLEEQSIFSVIARHSCPITAFVFDYKF